MKKLRCTVHIEKPIQICAEVFLDPAALKYWQDGFEKIIPLDGAEGKAGSTAEIHYQMGKRKMVLQELILENSLPDRFVAEYRSDYTFNTMETSFTQEAPSVTRIDMEVEYLEMKGAMMNILAFIYPSMFKKQVQKWLNQFKAHVESL